MTDEDVQNRLDRLESLVEHQQAEIDRQQETIAAQYERIAELERQQSVDANEDRLIADGTSVKVLGEIDAPDGTGVFGHNTATSGQAHGVEGVTDSAADGATAVRGHATASGITAQTYGIRGITEADASFPGGPLPVGVNGLATGTGGVTGISGNVPNDPDGAGVFGGAAKGTGVVGRTDAATDGSMAINGVATATSGRTIGVNDRTHSSEDGAAGIRGEATQSSGKTFGVYGRGSSRDGRGVLGDATKGGSVVPPSSGVPAGVVGITDRSGADSSVTEAYGVGGTHTASSGVGYGVFGRSSSSDGFGVYSDTDAKTNGIHLMSGGVVHQQRGDPNTDELAPGEVMVFNADGTGTGNAGDLVYAINDDGTIKTSVVVQQSNAS